MCKLQCKNINKYNLKNNIFILKHSVRWRERERERRGEGWKMEGRKAGEGQERGRRDGGREEGEENE